MGLDVRNNGNDNVEIRAAETRTAQRADEALETAADFAGQPKVTHTMRTINRTLSRRISRNTGSEQVLNLRRLMEKELEDKGFKDDFIMVTVDPNQYSVPYPTLVVMSGAKVGDHNHFFGYVLPLVAGLAPLPRREEQGPHGNILVPRTWVDNLNGTFINEVMAAMYAAIGGKSNGTARIAGLAVVTNEITAESAHLATTLLSAADNAIQTAIEIRLGDKLGLPQFNLGMMASDQPISSVQYNTSGMQDSDIVGNPVRSDITVTISNRIRQAMSDYDSQQRLVATTGYIDLTYSPQNPTFNQGPVLVNGYPVPPTVQYQPRYVMTSAYPLELDAFTPNTFVLGLIGTIATLNSGMAWAQSLISNAARGIGPHNPGALAMVLDPEVTAPLDLSTQTNEQIYKFLQQVLYPSLLISIDVPEEGEYSWLLRMIPAAEKIYTGKVEGEVREISEGYKALFRAFDDTTLGCFSKKYQYGAPLVYATGNRIPLGHYNHQDGHRHDIRDMDDLYMMNITNPDTVEAWEDSFDRTDMTMSQRVVARHEIIDRVLSGSWEQTGWAMRYDFDPLALQALIEAAADAGFTIRPENIQHLAGTAVRGNMTARARGLGNISGNIYARSDRPNVGVNNMGGAFNLF